MPSQNTEDKKELADISALNVEEYAKLVGARMSGAKLASVLNIPQQELEHMYALAHSHYIAKNFKDALELFKYLVKMDDLDARFCMGLAGCYHEKKEYEMAIEAYKKAMIASTLQDPYALYYCAICYLKTEKLKEALALLKAVPKVGESEKHANIHKQSQDLLDLLTKKD